MWEARVQDRRLVMAGPHNLSTPGESQRPPSPGAEQRSGAERRLDSNPQPPPGQEERRMWVRRRIEVPVVYRPLQAGSLLEHATQRGLTHTLAPGGLGVLLEEDVRVGTFLELLVRLEGDLLAVEGQVVSVCPQEGKFLHNCRFTRLGTADRNLLSEYLSLRDPPPATAPR